jgi:hypothetical protein
VAKNHQKISRVAGQQNQGVTEMWPKFKLSWCLIGVWQQKKAAYIIDILYEPVQNVLK